MIQEPQKSYWMVLLSTLRSSLHFAQHFPAKIPKDTPCFGDETLRGQFWIGECLEWKTFSYFANSVNTLLE